MTENESAIGGFDRSWYNLDVDFDGSEYSMTWRQLDFGSSKLPRALFMDGSDQALQVLEVVLQGRCIFLICLGQDQPDGDVLDAVLGDEFFRRPHERVPGCFTPCLTVIDLRFRIQLLFNLLSARTQPAARSAISFSTRQILS